MGVPTWEVGYTSAMPRREDHEVRQGHVGHWIKKNTSFQLNSYWFLIAYQFTTHNKCSNGPPPESMQVRKRLIMTVAPFQRSRGDCECFNRHKYWVHKSLLFSSGTECNELFRRPYRQKKSFKNMWSKCQSVAPQNFASIIWYELFSLFWCGGPTPEICPNI